MKMFEYQLQLSKKRKTVALKVTDTGVKVYVPHSACMSEVERWLETKQAWVTQQKRKLESGVQPQVPWDANELMVFGQAYRLVANANEVSRVEHETQTVFVKQIDNIAALRKQLIQLLSDETQLYIEGRLPYLCKVMNTGIKSVKYKEYKSRWGSCSSRGELTFNVLLAGAPQAMIDYVVVHELAHRHILAHNKAFWQLVSYHYHNYREAVLWFKKFGKQLFIDKT